MNDFAFGDSLFYLTNKFENFTQSQSTCGYNGSVIANLKRFSFEKFIKILLRNQASNLNKYTYLRVHPVNHTLDKCYGLLEIFFLDTEAGLDGNVNDVCNNNQFLNGKYNTLCSKKIKNLNMQSNLVSKDTESPLTSVIITVSVFVFVALISGLFICFIRKRRLSKIRQQTSSLEEQQIINESENVSFTFHKNYM